MDELRFYQRSWFYLIFPPILIAILYFFTAPQDADLSVYLRGIVEDLIIYVVLLVIWLAFFAQFVLPVQTFKARQNIFYRLLIYLMGAHGPAIFIRDGQPIKSEGEERKQGLGVLWLDSASGVVTRTDAAFKNTFGPGVHFTESGERIAGYVDLHVQTDSLGPKESEDPFAKKLDTQSEEEYRFVQERRFETSALTRDGIEIVANISVTFKVDADPITDPHAPGSRFGFAADAVRLAITGQAINPDLPKDAYRYHVPWNQLPSLLAVDAWRDLLSKFTLNDLFERKYVSPPSFSDTRQPTLGPDASSDPVKPQDKFADFLTDKVRTLNQIISKWADQGDSRGKPTENVEQKENRKENKADSSKENKVTGLQVINFLIEERLKKLNFAALDPYGNFTREFECSHEHKFLQQHGICVLSAGASTLRLPPEVDAKLINQWTANWLERARAERDRLDQEEGFSDIQQQEDTLRDYIVQLSDDLLLQVDRQRARDARETLRALLLESRAVLVNETQLFREKSPERESLEDVIQWLESTDL